MKNKNEIGDALGIKEKRMQVLFKLGHLALIENNTVSASIKSLVSDIPDPTELAAAIYCYMMIKTKLERD